MSSGGGNTNNSNSKKKSPASTFALSSQVPVSIPFSFSLLCLRSLVCLGACSLQLENLRKLLANASYRD